MISCILSTQYDIATDGAAMAQILFPFYVCIVLLITGPSFIKTWRSYQRHSSSCSTDSETVSAGVDGNQEEDYENMIADDLLEIGADSNDVAATPRTPQPRPRPRTDFNSMFRLTVNSCSFVVLMLFSSVQHTFSPPPPPQLCLFCIFLFSYVSVASHIFCPLKTRPCGHMCTPTFCIG
jgi:hypothetical protein